jgi:hypothetical protein
MELSETSVEKVDVSAYTIPTDAPEGDGTVRWDSTTLIVCEVHAANQTGLGYTTILRDHDECAIEPRMSACDATANNKLLSRSQDPHPLTNRVVARSEPGRGELSSGGERDLLRIQL